MNSESSYMAEDRLGFIGLGTMGMPMSLNILDAGKALTVWGRNREKLQDALDAGLLGTKSQSHGGSL